MKIQTSSDTTQLIVVRNKQTLQRHILVLKGEFEITSFTSNDTFPSGLYFEKLDSDFVLRQTAYELEELQDKKEELEKEVEVLRHNLDRYRKKLVG